eukprot:223780_1
MNGAMLNCCSNCKSNKKKLQRCAACMAVCYCSKECQILHWKSGHKTECKMKQIDRLLLDLSNGEKTGFMQPKYFDEKLLEMAQRYADITLGFGDIPPMLPPLMDFIDPVRYLTNILDADWDIIDDTRKNKENSDQKLEKAFDINEIKHTSPCQEVFGIMQYLSMCGRVERDYLSFFDDSKREEKALNVLHNFVHKNNSPFSMLFVLIGLSQYKIIGGNVHYVSVIKMNNKYRLIQSFGKHFSLKEELEKRDWMNAKEIEEILNCFVYLESIGISTSLTDTDILKIKEQAMISLGFELEIEANESERPKHETMCAVIMKDMSFKHFVNSAKHLLEYMKFLLNKLEKRELNADGTPLCYRMGYPTCIDYGELKRINDVNGWGYKIK